MKVWSLVGVVILGVADGEMPLFQPDLKIVQEDQSLEDIESEAHTFLRQGINEYENNQFNKALDSWNRSLSLYQQSRNRRGEAISLNNLGLVYRVLGDNAQAVNFYMQSLYISREVGDYRGVINTLFNLESIHAAMQQHEDSIRFLQEAIELLGKFEDPVLMQSALINLGIAHQSLGNYQESISVYLQSIESLRDLRNKTLELSILRALGDLYFVVDSYEDAISAYLQSMEISENLGDLESKSDILDDLGNVYDALGLYETSISFYQASLEIDLEINNQRGRAHSLNGLGLSHFSLNEYEKAIDFFNLSIDIIREIDDRRGETASLTGLGLVFFSLGEYKKSLDAFQMSLDISQNTGDQVSEGINLGGIGNIYYVLGQYERSADFHFRHLLIARSLNDRSSVAMSLNNLIFSIQAFRSLERISLFALLKESINIYESIRNDTENLSMGEQQSHLKTISKVYENLASELLNQNRILEAQRVLDLLRQQELEEFLKTTRGNANTATGITLNPTEQRFIDLFYERLDAGTLNGFWDSDEVAQLERELQTTATTELPDIQNLQTQLEDPNTAILQTLILDDRLELILSRPTGDLLLVTVKIDRTELNQLILDARNAVRFPTTDPKPALQALYNVTIAPLRDRLEGIDTLIYSPDSVLRYVPLAALYDGQQYLIENFAINHVTAVSITDLTAQPSPNPSILAGAFTDGYYAIEIGDETYEYSGLPGADREVRDIEALFGDARTVRDLDFSKDAIEQGDNSANILHLATHAQFVPGAPSHSFVLFGDGSTADFNDLRDWELPNTDLVVLSACETGLDGVQRGENGIEILGFSYLMQEAGAKATLSSLWQVNDNSTGELMSAFYTQLKAGQPVSRALQQAQIAAIRNGTESDRDTRGNCELDVCFDSGFAPLRATTDHPYYWAPFIAIGNGL
jgi:CHAT domain-containing protein/tetratricopeptide (TPR) repeat protein